MITCILVATLTIISLMRKLDNTNYYHDILFDTIISLSDPISHSRSLGVVLIYVLLLQNFNYCVHNVVHSSYVCVTADTGLMQWLA